MDLESRLRRYGETFDAAVDAHHVELESHPVWVPDDETHAPRRLWIGLAAASLAAMTVFGLYQLSTTGADRPPQVSAGAPVPPGTASPSDCISGGATTVTVPDVIGKRLGPAIREIEAAGLNVVGYGVTKTDPVASTSRVFEQNPAAGATASRGGCVDFRTVAPTHKVSVVAVSAFAFDHPDYVVWPGKVTVQFSGTAGLTLAFDDPRLQHCFLRTDPVGPHTCQVTLTPGRYLIYDVVPGHRLVGLEATIVVAKPGS